MSDDAVLSAANEDEANRALARARAYEDSGDRASALRMLRLAQRLRPSNETLVRIQRLERGWWRMLGIAPEYREPLRVLYTAVLVVAVWRFIIAGWLFPPSSTATPRTRHVQWGWGVGVFPVTMVWYSGSAWNSVMFVLLSMMFNYLANQRRRR